MTDGRLNIRIVSDGAEVPITVVGSLMSLKIRSALFEIPRAELIFGDGNPSTGEWTIASAGYFNVGVEVDIHLGFGDSATNVFKGFVTGLNAFTHRRQATRLKVTLRDKAIQLTGSRRTREWIDVSDADIASQIASEAGLTAITDGDGLQHAALPQLNTRDWDLLMRRARALGFVLYSQLGELVFRPPEFNGEIAHELAFGSSLLECDMRLDASEAASNFALRSWDPGEQEPIDASVEPDSLDGPRPGEVRLVDILDVFSGRDQTAECHGGLLSSEEIDAWGNGLGLIERLALIVGKAKTIGLPEATVDSLVLLEGFGDTFNGEHYVTAVEHRIDRSGFVTELQLGLPRDAMCLGSLVPESFAEPPAIAGGLVPGQTGIHLGQVVSLDDPPQPGMVRVRLETQDPGADGVWARLIRPDAGDGRGFCFLPEIGDEVVIQFINGDPRFPVILGSLWSSAKSPPLDATDENHDRLLVSRSGVALKMTDEQGKEALSLTTPGGHEVRLDDEQSILRFEDSNGNVIELNNQGIVIESAGKIELKASSDVVAEARNRLALSGTSTLSAESQGSVSLSGMPIRLN